MSRFRKRLDQLLVERGLVTSRTRASGAVRAGLVHVAGRLVTKPANAIDIDADIVVDAPVHPYVSRAALKLIHALDYFRIEPTNLECLDVGASTGGFVQVLLMRGAKHVTAIDVGHGQLVPEIAADPRVTSIEGLNAKDLTLDCLPGHPDLVACDVSFISLMKALPAALALASKGACLVALIKPQFEAGRGNVGKGGIVRDAAVHRKICAEVSAWLSAASGWHVLGITESPIAGGDGNKEFLIAARHD
jgi:23S rRNA (cytidine1920-2'-O)/16S rRNA (cytidine1409-2'-O)-methyltransferase